MTNKGIATQPTVIVTGGNRGLRAAVAAGVHDAGWRVIGTARNPEKADPAAMTECHQQESLDA